MENIKIKEAIITIFEGADKQDWKSIENVMATNVLLDYTSFVGGEPALLTPKDITQSWASFLPGFDTTHHQLNNFTIYVEDDIANVAFTGKANHFIGNKVWTVDGTYDCTLKKINNNWLVTKLKFNLIEQCGNKDLPAIAIEKMKR
jgi:SnoaL-like domain